MRAQPVQRQRSAGGARLEVVPLLDLDFAGAVFFRTACARHGASPRADQTLFAAGDPGDGCYCFDKGVLKVSLFSPNAAERILAILSAGTVVGDLSMIDGMPDRLP